MNLQQLNQLSETEFTQTLGAIFEHSPWVAEQAWAMRPFDSLEALHTSMCHMVEQAPHDQQLALICAHPDLGAKAKMAEASVQEQKGAGLDQLSQAEFNQLHHYNQNYKTRFEFPFILAVKGKNKHDILSSMAERLSNDPSTEFRRALQEIYKIAGFRLHDLIKQGGGE